MTDVDLIKALYNINCVQFGDFTLKSGKQSPIYINLRFIISYPSLLQAIAKRLSDAVERLSYDVVCGVPYTALPIATAFSLLNNIPMVLRRKERKDYGTKSKIEGQFEPQQRCLIIEDIITTGSSILETANDLQEVGLDVQHAITIIDREENGIDNLESHLTVLALFPLSVILQTITAANWVKQPDKMLLTNYLESLT